MFNLFFTKYIKNYLSNIDPSKTHYNLFNLSLEIYDASLNPSFIPHIESKISHLYFQYSMVDKHTVKIKKMYMKIDNWNIFKNEDEGQVNIEIEDLTIIYNNIQINISNILDNECHNITVINHNIKILDIAKGYKQENEYRISGLKCDISHISKLYTQGQEESNDEKYAVFINSINVNNNMLLIDNITIQDSNEWICQTSRFVYQDIILKNLYIKYTKEVLCEKDMVSTYRGYNGSDSIFCKFDSVYFSATDIEANIYYNGDICADVDIQYTFPKSANTLHDTIKNLKIFPDVNLYCNLKYLDDNASFNVRKMKRNIIIKDININHKIFVDYVEISKYIVIYNARILSSDKPHNSNIEEIVKMIDYDIIIFNLITPDFIINKLYFNYSNSNINDYTVLLRNMVEASNEHIINEYTHSINDDKDYTSPSEYNRIEYIEIFPDDVLNIFIYSCMIRDIIPLLQHRDSNMKVNITLHDTTILYDTLRVFSKHISISEDIILNIEVYIHDNLVLESCDLKYSKNKLYTDKLSVNISVNILERIMKLSKFHMSHTSNGSHLQVEVDHININLYDTSNKEVISCHVYDTVASYSISKCKSLRVYDNEDLHLHEKSEDNGMNLNMSIRSIQIDDQKYDTKSPIIFYTLCKNILNISIVNNEVFINLGKFELHLEEYILQELYKYREIFFNQKSSNHISQFINLSLVRINQISFLIYYKYFLDIKLDSLCIMNDERGVNSLLNRIVSYYKTKLSWKLSNLIYRNVRNMITGKGHVLAYKGDNSIPHYSTDNISGRLRIRYPMPMRYRISKYNLGLAVAYYIYNKMEKLQDEYFLDGSFVRVIYDYKYKEEMSRFTYKCKYSGIDGLGKNCLVLTTKRLLISSELGIKEMCLDDIHINQNRKHFMIGKIRIEPEIETFIGSLFKYICTISL